jgi:flagellar biosynthesis/type III secretory pathway M-ring protein FliF/YscJ
VVILVVVAIVVAIILWIVLRKKDEAKTIENDKEEKEGGQEEEHNEEEGAVIENDSGIAKEAACEPAVEADEAVVEEAKTSCLRQRKKLLNMKQLKSIRNRLLRKRNRLSSKRVCGFCFLAFPAVVSASKIHLLPTTVGIESIVCHGR